MIFKYLCHMRRPVTVTISRGQVMFTIVQMPCGQWPGKG